MTSWGGEISSFQPCDTQPLPPRITAKGRQSKQYHAQENTKRDQNRGLMLAVLWQAAMDYHGAKKIQKRYGISEPHHLRSLNEKDSALMTAGHKAWEWFTLPPDTDNFSSGFTFEAICQYFHVNPKRMWRKIKKSPDISMRIANFRTGDALEKFGHGEAMS